MDHMTQPMTVSRPGLASGRTAFLFDLDGTLVDSVYQHVLAWREAMAAVGIELAVWTIHRRIGMSGVPRANATSGRLESARPTLEALGVSPGVPVVTRDQVAHAKPDPDLFLTAA